jgi:hypothetical protein
VRERATLWILIVGLVAIGLAVALLDLWYG